MITDEQANARVLWICVAVVCALPAIAALLNHFLKP